MSSYPIYRRNEPRSYPSNCSSRQMTPEEKQRFNVTEFKPARDSAGKVIRPPVGSPHKTKGQKATKPKKEHKPYEDKYPQVTKEFILAELASGKKLYRIGEEHGMSKGLIFQRAKRWGIVLPKKLRGEKIERSKKYGNDKG